MPTVTDTRIELVYDRDCPNVERARAMIHEALTTVNAPLLWTEWVRDAEGTPEMLRTFGSPTVLVNGRDVAYDGNGAISADAHNCRVYFDDSGCICGAPSARLIVAAIVDGRGQ